MPIFPDKDMLISKIYLYLHLSMQENPFAENYRKYSNVPLFHYKNHSLSLRDLDYLFFLCEPIVSCND